MRELSFSLSRREFIRLRRLGDYRELGLRFWVAFSFVHGWPLECARRKWRLLTKNEQVLCDS